MDVTRIMGCLACALGSLSIPACDDPGEETSEKNTLRHVVDQQNDKWDATNDYGGTVVQSFKAGVQGDIQAVRVALEGRENTRELLVTLRKADDAGFPMGKILASGVVDVAPRDKPETFWHEVTFENPYRQSPDEELCICLTPSVIKTGSYGFFEYAYSYKDKYPHGRLNSRQRGRKTIPDDGKDLCFAVIVNAPEGLPAKPTVRSVPMAAPVAKPAKSAEMPRERRDKLERLVGFLGMRHIPLDNHEGYHVRMWRYTRGDKYREPLVDEVIDSRNYDIFYGLNTFDTGGKDTILVHTVSGQGGGGTRYSHDFGGVRHYKLPTGEFESGKSVKLMQNLAPDDRKSFIWFQLDSPGQE